MWALNGQLERTLPDQNTAKSAHKLKPAHVGNGGAHPKQPKRKNTAMTAARGLDVCAPNERLISLR